MAPSLHAGRVLAVDVGGTHTRLWLQEGDRETPAVRARLRSADHPSLEALLSDFLAAHGGAGLRSACIAVAGPVIDGAARVTNLPWRVEAAALAERLSIRHLHLMNDLEATAFGMLHLPSDSFEVLQAGTRQRVKGPVVVAAAGTGFGLAVLDWDGTRHHPRPTEAGHVSYAARNPREIEVLRGLQRRYGRVSLEHVVSGPGLAAVYDVLCDDASAASPDLAAGDRSAAIANAALDDTNPLAAAALEVFCESYAAALGDAALSQLALGGVWIGGAIAGKILPALRRDRIREAFCDKGRFRPLLESLPLEVCLEPDTALRGATELALRNAEGD